MNRILLTALLIVTANTVAATSLSIKHNKKLPTPYELITKGRILDKSALDLNKNYGFGTMRYFIAWDKTDDIYWCYLYGTVNLDANAQVKCRLATQETQSTVK